MYRLVQTWKICSYVCRVWTNVFWFSFLINYRNFILGTLFMHADNCSGSVNCLSLFPLLFPILIRYLQKWRPLLNLKCYLIAFRELPNKHSIERKEFGQFCVPLLCKTRFMYFNHQKLKYNITYTQIFFICMLSKYCRKISNTSL